MGQIADAHTWLAQVAAEEEQVCVQLKMSRHKLGELEKCWKAVEREAGQGKCNIKQMQADIKTLRKKVDATGWNAEKEQAREEALCRAKDDAMRCTQVHVAGQKK
jgi:structural maintenance of chromosome 2